MMLRTSLAGAVILLAAAAGCYTGGSALDGAIAAAGNGSANGTTTSVDGTETTSKVTGLPCDVAAVIANSCATCHGDRLTGGAPNRMVSYEDMMAVTGADGDLTVAQVTLARMKDAKDPMPPSGASPADIEVISKWIAAGMPAGTCESSVGAPVTSEYDTPSVCTSKKRWTRGDRKSPEMHPGVACIECHDREDEAPGFSASGTVYPTAHEPDDCNGIGDTKTTTVELTDATGKVFRTTVNAVGNFYFESRKSAIKMPYTAKVISGGKTRVMKDPVDTGDCNACHTEKGTEKAPGRVMKP